MTTKQHPNSVDFAAILASSIHDIKNSLGLILGNLEDLVNDPRNRLADPRRARLLQHEAQRANANLIQLLALYKLGTARLAIRVEEHNLDEVLAEVVADNIAACQALDIELEYACDPLLNGYFDADLVRSLLSSTIGNAQRHTLRQIRVSAESHNNGVTIRVEDDGQGFDQEMLGQFSESEPPALDYGDITRTQLGFYFAVQIARLHHSRGRHGHIRLRNQCHLPGGCFELWLP